MWLLEKFFLWDTSSSPEQMLYLARSGSQSPCAIWFILPARGANHIITLSIELFDLHVHCMFIC